MAYLEFIQGEDGKRKRIGPMGEKEEMGAKDSWQVGASHLIVETHPDSFLRAGEERSRSCQTQERPGGSDLDSRRIRG